MEQVVEKKSNTAIKIGVALALAGSIYGVFFYKDKNDKTFYSKISELIRQKGMTREKAIEIINEASSKPFVDANAYDTDYLVARAKAIKSKSDTFVLDGKTYNTKTGRAV